MMLGQIQPGSGSGILKAGSGGNFRSATSVADPDPYGSVSFWSARSRSV